MGEEPREQNMHTVMDALAELMKEQSYDYIIGITGFETVFCALMPVQQKWLRNLCKERFNDLVEIGSFVSFGISYYDSIIDTINVKKGGETDLDSWNLYGDEYSRLNEMLDTIASKLASRFDGISIPATLHGLAGKIENVTDYYGRTISHRAVAERAGLGWRGKNGLLINHRFGCAVRFASVAVTLPLDASEEVEYACGDCTACEDACTFIKHRVVLPDYRENCRRYIANLRKKGLKKDVCGKCIQACIRNGIHATSFELRAE
ncbi:MAG: epoxyqueuosine reductase [Candidatus Thorarchaeota archaeon]|nr:MAG: epoxyqueuosine reductase [Candidatus Thorarchaeota archaeon]